MATIVELANRSSQKTFTEVFLKRRFADGTYENEYVDISRDLVSLGGVINKAIDSRDFDIGIFRENNLSITFNNKNGRYNDIEDSRSYWATFDSRHMSKVKVVYGYLDDNNEKVGSDVFEGLLDDRLMKIGSNDSVKAVILSRQFVFTTLTVAGGTFSSPIKASLALEIILTRTEVLEQFNIDPLLIDPDLDIIIDVPEVYNGKKLNQVINEILFYTNSVGFVDLSGNFVVRGRRVGNRITHRFYSNPAYSAAKDNVLSISGKNSGRQRIKNLIEWGDISSKSIKYNLDRYGITRRGLGTNAITNDTTKQTIVNRVLQEWQYPKDEFELTTDYLGDTIAILDVVTCDIQPEFDRHDNLPFSGEAISGEAVSVGYVNGIFIEPNRGFKAISVSHNILKTTTTLKLREIGFTNFDGYFDMLTTHKYTVEFIAQTEVSISTSAKSIDATCALINILDPSDENKNIDIDIRRPNVSTLKFVSPVPITKTFTALVLEVLAT